MAKTFVLKKVSSTPYFWGEAGKWVNSTSQAKFMSAKQAKELEKLSASFFKVTEVVDMHMTKKRLRELQEARKFMNAIDWDFNDDTK